MSKPFSRRVLFAIPLLVACGGSYEAGEYFYYGSAFYGAATYSKE